VRDSRYAWYIVGVGALIYMMVFGTTFGAFGLFVHPVSAEFHLSRAQMNSALVLINLGNAAVAPGLGWLLDRLGVRRVFHVAALSLAGSFLILGASRSLWLDVAALALMMPIGLLGAGSLTFSMLIARWFSAQRGRAMALMGVGMYLGNVTFAPLMGLLMQAEGWRHALLVLGGATGVILTVLGLTLREPPATAPTVEAAAPPARPMSLGEVLRLPDFWTLACAAGVAFGVAQTLSITLVPLAVEGGFSVMSAAGLVSISGFGSIAGGLVLSVFADRFDRLTLLMALSLVGVAMNLAFRFAHGYEALAAVAFVLGVVTGTITPSFYAILADRFGPASYGTVRGLALPITSVFGMAAVRIAGEIYDRTGGYALVFDGFMGAFAFAAALMIATRYFPRRQAPAAAL
jgi:MFS family permease